MRSVLSAESPAVRALTRGYELVLLSIGWWLLALPLVTLPVATDWLVTWVRRTGRGESVPGPRATLDHVRTRFVVTTRLGLLHLGIAVLVAIGLFGPSPGPLAGPVIMVVSVAVAATWALVAPWSVVLLDHGSRAALRRAYVRALRHLSSSFLSAVAVITGAALVAIGPLVIKLPLVLLVPGLVALTVTTLCHRAAPPDPVIPSTIHEPSFAVTASRGSAPWRSPA